MPAHWGFPRLRVLTTSSVTGTQTLHAVGAALAARLSKNDAVAVTTLGEGAASQGEFHEACNFAAVKRLPVIFVVESNGWAISEPKSEQSAVSTVALRASAYGFPGVHVDGNDPAALVPSLCAAVERARAGEGPTLIDAECVRITAQPPRPGHGLPAAARDRPRGVRPDRGRVRRPGRAGLWDEDATGSWPPGRGRRALERAMPARCRRPASPPRLRGGPIGEPATTCSDPGADREMSATGG